MTQRNNSVRYVCALLPRCLPSSVAPSAAHTAFSVHTGHDILLQHDAESQLEVWMFVCLFVCWGNRAALKLALQTVKTSGSFYLSSRSSGTNIVNVNMIEASFVLGLDMLGCTTTTGGEISPCLWGSADHLKVEQACCCRTQASKDSHARTRVGWCNMVWWYQLPVLGRMHNALHASVPGYRPELEQAELADRHMPHPHMHICTYPHMHMHMWMHPP